MNGGLRNTWRVGKGHPEYEVKDWRGRPYFVDFMWIVGRIRVAFEIMDHGSHGTDRTKFRRDLGRTLFLQSQDCLVYSISLDELKENPMFIVSVLRTLLASYLTAANVKSGEVDRPPYNKIERSLMLLAIRHDREIRPTQAARELEMHTATVIKHCRQLVIKGKFRPVAKGKSGRVTSYEYIGALHSPDLV